MSGGSSGTIKVWDSGVFWAQSRPAADTDSSLPPYAATLELRNKKTNAHSDDINSVAFSPDGTKIVSASDDKTIKVWDSGHVATPP